MHANLVGFGQFFALTPRSRCESIHTAAQTARVARLLYLISISEPRCYPKSPEISGDCCEHSHPKKSAFDPISPMRILWVEFEPSLTPPSRKLSPHHRLRCSPPPRLPPCRSRSAAGELSAISRRNLNVTSSSLALCARRRAVLVRKRARRELRPDLGYLIIDLPTRDATEIARDATVGAVTSLRPRERIEHVIQSALPPHSKRFHSISLKPSRMVPNPTRGNFAVFGASLGSRLP